MRGMALAVLMTLCGVAHGAPELTTSVNKVSELPWEKELTPGYIERGKSVIFNMSVSFNGLNLGGRAVVSCMDDEFVMSGSCRSDYGFSVQATKSLTTPFGTIDNPPNSWDCSGQPRFETANQVQLLGTTQYRGILTASVICQKISEGASL
jgi:hypothetical protein